jgi:hypothetical protein
MPVKLRPSAPLASSTTSRAFAGFQALAAAVVYDLMQSRLPAAEAYRWADLSVTSVDNPRTPQPAEHLGAVIFRRCRVYRKWLAGAPLDQAVPPAVPKRQHRDATLHRASPGRAIMPAAGRTESAGPQGFVTCNKTYSSSVQEFAMISRESPGGSIFPYYYKNGELFGAHYEGFAGREDALLERMRAEEEFFARQNHPLPYWVNFYGTKLTDKGVSEFMQSMNRLQRHIPRLAIVGCSVIDRWRLGRARKTLGVRIPVRYFSDPEDAKTWLVSELFR